MSVGSDGTPPPVILNACLSFIRFSMLSKDKLNIKNATVSRFDLDALKIAHGLITESCGGSKKFRGPNGAGYTAKCAACFDDIFRILTNLDAEKFTTEIACPYDEIHKLLPDSESPDQNVLANRIQKLEFASNSSKTVQRLDEVESALLDLKQTVIAIMTAPDSSDMDLQPSQVGGRDNVFIPSASDYPDLPRSRSDSKRRRSEDSDKEGEFVLPRDQQRKLHHQKKRKLSNTPITLATVVANSAPKKTSHKPFNWGKSSSEDIKGFSGRVPAAFISRCSLDTQEDVIKNHLINKGIKVTNIELKSKPIAKTRSFKVSVQTHDDFDKLISGDFIPKNVKIEKFIYYKTFSNKSSLRRQPEKAAQTQGDLLLAAQSLAEDLANEVQIMESNKLNSSAIVPREATTPNDVANKVLSAGLSKNEVSV